MTYTRAQFLENSSHYKKELCGGEKPIPLSTGREWDKETGLYYYRARYYDPMEGRFISKDPIGFRGGDANLYGYVRNNPTNLTDPSGMVPPTPGMPDHVNPGAVPDASGLLDEVSNFLSFYHAIDLTNEAMAKIDAAKTTINCGRSQQVTLCFDDSAPHNIRVFTNSMTFSKPGSHCGVFPISGTNCCH